MILFIIEWYVFVEQSLGQLSASWNEGRISRWKVATLLDRHTHTDWRLPYCELGNRTLYKRHKNKYRKCFSIGGSIYTACRCHRSIVNTTLHNVGVHICVKASTKGPWTYLYVWQRFPVPCCCSQFIFGNWRQWKKLKEGIERNTRRSSYDSTLRGHCYKLLRVKLELAPISQIRKYKVYREYQSFPSGWK